MSKLNIIARKHAAALLADLTKAGIKTTAADITEGVKTLIDFVKGGNKVQASEAAPKTPYVLAADLFAAAFTDYKEGDKKSAAVSFFTACAAPDAEILIEALVDMNHEAVGDIAQAEDEEYGEDENSDDEESDDEEMSEDESEDDESESDDEDEMIEAAILETAEESEDSSEEDAEEDDSEDEAEHETENMPGEGMKDVTFPGAKSEATARAIRNKLSMNGDDESRQRALAIPLAAQKKPKAA